MTCHFYNQCGQCSHEFYDTKNTKTENSEARLLICPICGSDKIKEVIACDFKGSRLAKKGWRGLFWSFFRP